MSPRALGLRQVRSAQLARPPSGHRSAPARQARGSSGWKVRSWRRPAASYREDLKNIWWGLRGHSPRGQGWDEDLQVFPLVKRDWLPSHTNFNPRARVTAPMEPRFLGDPNGAPQSFPFAVSLNFPACLSRPSLEKGCLLWLPVSPWPSWFRQVVPERPRLIYSTYPSFPRDFSKLHHCLASRQVLGCPVGVSYTGF